MALIPFKCPSCSGQKFAVTSDPKSYDEFLGAVCPDCGHAITDEDIKRQARDIALKKAKEAFKRSWA
jgi:hypothetical protein